MSPTWTWEPFTVTAKPFVSCKRNLQWYDGPDDIQRRVAELGPWFHNLELGGVQTAPAHFLGDYPACKWRQFADAIPPDLTGKTVLDMGCDASFYFLETKRRGAARVVGWILKRIWPKRGSRRRCGERTSSFITFRFTTSDGEAFTEGFKRLGLGKVIGMRTWGGEIWLASDNWLVDKGIATAAEYGVYGPEGKWLIEGHGVDPDIVVDNLPHATYEGKDAQLEKAIQVLEDEIKAEPVVVPPPPPHPIKAFK